MNECKRYSNTRYNKWVFKNGSSEICGRQPYKADNTMDKLCTSQTAKTQKGTY